MNPRHRHPTPPKKSRDGCVMLVGSPLRRNSGQWRLSSAGITAMMNAWPVYAAIVGSNHFAGPGLTANRELTSVRRGNPELIYYECISIGRTTPPTGSRDRSDDG